MADGATIGANSSAEHDLQCPSPGATEQSRPGDCPQLRVLVRLLARLAVHEATTAPLSGTATSNTEDCHD